MLIALVAGLRTTPVSQSGTGWSASHRWGTTSTVTEPAFVLMSQTHAVLWRPDTVLTYQTIDGPSTRFPILVYPDVSPRRWATAPAGSRSYHVVWIENDGQARSALVSMEGQTLRGPVSLTSTLADQFIALPYSDGHLDLIWLDSRTHQLLSTGIDSTGRPTPAETVLVSHATYAAAALDQSQVRHLVWFSSTAPDTLTLSYQTASESPITLFTLTLSPEQSVGTLQIGLDETHGYAIFSTVSAAQPDIEHIQLISFPLEQPAQTTLTDLPLPAAGARWPRPAPGQASILPIALALKTATGWHPAVIEFQGGRLLNTQIVADTPADASPPLLDRDSAGSLYLAWLGLDGSTIDLYTAHTTSQTEHKPTENSGVRTLSGALLAAVLSLVWFMPPLLITHLAPSNNWTTPLGIALYGGCKLLWPSGLYTHLPPLLSALGPDRAGWITGFTVLLIGLLATASLLARRSGRLQWIAYALPDALLTWIIFGANLL